MKSAIFLILGTACLAVGLLGYRIGRDQPIPATTPIAMPIAGSRQAGRDMTDGIRNRSPAELASLNERLKRDYAASPAAEHDWILRGRTAAVLATMRTVELESLLREILSPSGDPPRRRPGGWQPLTTDLLREWGKRDPVAACTTLADLPASRSGRIEVFRDWLLRDPAAAAAWVNSGEEIPPDLRMTYLSERVKSDPHDALRKLATLEPQTREDSAIEWSISAALIPAQREALLAALGDDPALYRKCAERITVALAERAVDEAREFVDGLELDEDATTSLHDRIFERWAVRDPQIAFAAWRESGESRVSNPLLHALDLWSLNSPGKEEALRWISTLRQGPAKERIQHHMIQNLTRHERFEQAVRLGLAMEDREEGKRQASRVAETWREKFPHHAAQRLPDILRDHGVELR